MIKTDSFVLDLVVPIHGNLPLNELFFESLVRNTHYPFRLIVIDNASSDESPSFFEHQKGDRFQVLVVRNSVNRCYPVSMNQGIAISTSPVVGLLNNDIVVGPEWDRPLADFILEGKGDIASPIGLEHLPAKNWEEILFYRWRSILKKNYSDNPGENYRQKINVMYGEFDQFSRWITRKFSEARFPGIMGHCHLVSRDLMIKTGGLDVRLQAADWDLYLTAAKLQSQGEIKSLPMILGSSWVHHFIRGSAKNIRKVAFSCDHPPHLYPEGKWGVEAIRNYWPFLDQRPGYKKGLRERARKILNRWRGQLSQYQLPLESVLIKIETVKDIKAQ